MLSMGTVICAGTVPEIQWTATASSGIKWIRETHGQGDEQSTTSQYGTRVHVITPELVKGTHHPHITPMLRSILFYTTHLTRV